jgi:cell division protein FtsB
LQEYYPELVNGEKDGPDIQTVNYIGLINEVKNLKNKLSFLEEKNEVLENKNMKLQHEVKDIKYFLNLPI